MKKIKKFLNWKMTANWVLLAFAIVIIVFAAFGWKIAYTPQLENDWDAVAACGSWVSAIISGVAIWFAVSEPKRIANEQNKIALFEKRFESYSVFLKYTSFAGSIRQTENCDQLRQAFAFNFLDSGVNPDIKELILIIKNDEKLLMSGLFLFPGFCDGKTVANILQSIIQVVGLLQRKKTFSEDDKKKLALFCDICAEFEKFYIKKMREELAIIDS